MRQAFEFFCLFFVVVVVFFLLFIFLGFFPFNPTAHIHALYFFIVNHILIFSIVHAFNLPVSTLLFNSQDKGKVQ